MTASWPNPDPAHTPHGSHPNPVQPPCHSHRVEYESMANVLTSWNLSNCHGTSPCPPAIGQTEALRSNPGPQERPESTEEGSERSKPQRAELEAGKETKRLPHGHEGAWKEELKQLAVCLVCLGTGLSLYLHMSQRPQPDHKSTQPNVLPAAPTNTQEETQGFQSIRHSRRVSIQEPLPIIHNRRVSIQEPLPTIHNRRVSIQEPLPTIHNRRASIQEPPIVTSHWASTHDTPSVINSRQVSIENAPATISGHQASIQGAPSVTYSRRFNTRDVPPIFQTPYINTQNSPSITHTPLSNMESVIYNSSRASSNDSWPTSWSPHLSIQGLTLPNQARVNVSPSITHSPTVSVKSVDSVIWTSQEIFKDSVNSSQFYQNPLDNIQSTQTSISTEMDSGGFQNKGRRRHSQLPLAWKLLHGAKKISRQMSLALTLAGMVIISLISLGQPWMHFQVPLTPPGHPDGSLTIHINTIFFMQCPDIYCIQEYDQNAYLLDFAWAFLILASIASFFLCIILINIIFFTSSNLRMLDFSNVIISILAGTSMILGILFYLMQAHEFLQEGMTYSLGRSFYLAWISVFLFLMTGFFSYLNYMNFWSILALQAIWT